MWLANETADKPEKVILLKVKVSKVVFSVSVPDRDPVPPPPGSWAPSMVTVKFCAWAAARLVTIAPRKASFFIVRQGLLCFAELIEFDRRKDRTKSKLFLGIFRRTAPLSPHSQVDTAEVAQESTVNQQPRKPAPLGRTRLSGTAGFLKKPGAPKDGE